MDEHWTIQRHSWNAFHHASRIAVVALFALPILWVVAVSLRLTGLPPPSQIEWMPLQPAWKNYARAFELVPLGRQLVNSLLVTGVSELLTIVVASWAGFGLARLPRRAQRTLVIATLMLLMVPGVSLWLARFMIYKKLGLLDTYWALIAPALMGSSPLFVLLYYWAFSRMPAAMFEHARLDGAGELTMWLRLALPLSWPTTFVVSMLSFAMYWGDLIGPLLYLKSNSLYTAPVGLHTLQQLDVTNWPLLMAGVVIVTGPVAVVFLFAQHYLWSDRGDYYGTPVGESEI